VPVPTLTIGSDRATAVISPKHGGSVLRFDVDERPVLRPASGSLDPRQLACFPLVPYCNRIAGGRFEHGGTTVELSPNIEGEPHPLHGHGWLERWHVERADAESAEITLTYPAGSWPWRYRATQRFSVEGARLDIGLVLTNLSDRPMPAGIGLHPYFERPARISVNLDGRWVGPSTIPTRWEEHTGFRSVDTDSIVTDGTCTGWDGKAVIDANGRRIVLTADTRLLHVFSPPGMGFFCLEPVTAAPDALNHPDRGLTEIAPSESISIGMSISVEN
jgi:aldose 1-epimerase